MNLNRKAYRVRPSLISSQTVDGLTQARRTDSYPLATGYWSLRKGELGVGVWDLEDMTMGKKRPTQQKLGNAQSVSEDGTLPKLAARPPGSWILTPSSFFSCEA
jgi:hypothetical protein